jgi:hypothetical protein
MALAPEKEARFWAGVQRATEFFMGTANVQRALVALARRLDELEIPYAIAGAMALNELGYERVTSDVDVLLTREGLAAFKAAWLGRGYVEKFEGSKGMRDTENDVAIDVLIAGDYPGDGKPKPVSFPDPTVAIRGARVALLPTEKLVELKLASGMSAPHRLKDLADVLELVRHAHLEREMAQRLDPSVRDKYLELWSAAQHVDPE